MKSSKENQGSSGDQQNIIQRQRQDMANKQTQPKNIK